MLSAMSSYLYDRRKGLAKTAGFVGGAYLVGRYVMQRLEDVRDRVMEQRAARETIRKRFQQNMQDISFTIMAHMPILSSNILTDMDVEALTAELQALSRASKTRARPEPPPSESSLALSVELVRDTADVRSESGSVSVVSAQDEAGVSPSSYMVESQTSSSWVDRFSTGSSQSPPQSQHSSNAPSEAEEHADAGAGLLSAHNVRNLADSVTTTSSESGVSGIDMYSSQMSMGTRTKAELWREVKMLTITRTLTVLYATTLLSLFTHIQLSLLGRYKYVQSVIQLSRDEAAREQRAFDASIESLFFAAPSPRRTPDEEHGLMTEKVWDADEIWHRGVDEETERKYLTLSWWILNVGWKDVAERVRRGVEEVFEGVSLKSKLGPLELHRLLQDVRRRVEHEITFEGTERRTDFLSALLPPTSTMLTHLLTRSGLPPAHADTHEPAFTALLEETRDRLASADFALALERSLDRGTDALLAGVQKNVYRDEERLRVAGLLPGLARWSALALNGLPNELVDNLADTHEMAAFAAVIYTDYEDRFR